MEKGINVSRFPTQPSAPPMPPVKPPRNELREALKDFNNFYKELLAAGFTKAEAMHLLGNLLRGVPKK